ncbi:hypothetical protein [Microvirga soli]|uniref:hypothetical protein n=1 Tax=Microvirga soli TaxID=1854496 RepID=UPI00191FC7AB|nr:hypothetical protein [Microvirga soli]
MTCRETYPEPDIEAGIGAEALRGRYVPLFTALIGLLATLNVASVVFALME